MLDIRSAILGGVVATALIGAAAIVSNAVSGSSASPAEPLNVAISVAPTQTPSPSPAFSAIPSPPLPSPVPTRLSDRTDCASIRGSDYRSETERQWFAANCAAAPTPAPAGGTAATVSRPVTAAASSVDDYKRRFSSLEASYALDGFILAKQLSYLLLGGPFDKSSFADARSDLKATGSVARAMTPPSCFTRIHDYVVDGANEYDKAADAAGLAINIPQDIGGSSDHLSAGIGRFKEAKTLMASAVC